MKPSPLQLAACLLVLYEGGKSPADKFALKNAEFCLVSKAVKYVFVRIF